MYIYIYNMCQLLTIGPFLSRRLRPLTEERRCSAAEVWNEGEPLRAAGEPMAGSMGNGGKMGSFEVLTRFHQPKKWLVGGFKHFLFSISYMG